jgi:hypothetical protein
MTIQLINGQFSVRESLELLTQFIQVKIKFHEAKITSQSDEADIKMREGRIKELQNDLHQARQHINTLHGSLNVQASVTLTN